MRVLHTSDWHLGKKLEGQSRISEQKLFINALERVIKEENIDLVLLAGDIYDTYNPSAEAEKLFFDSIKQLSLNGKTGIIIIPGNHDNPQRLTAVSHLAKDYGVIIYDRAFQEIKIGKYGNLNIYNSVPGGIFIEKNNEKIYVYNLPFPSEATLNETFDNVKFNTRIKDILAEGVSYNKEDIPTIVMTHIYVAGSMGEGEVALELGGSRAIAINDLPEVNYIALGHVHKPMYFKEKNAYYCGSPIEYRVSENRFNKKIFIADITKNSTILKEIPLENYKPIKEYTVTGSEEAIIKSLELTDKNEWKYLNVEIDEPLTNSTIRKIKSNRNILEIVPIINIESKEIEATNYSEQSLEEAFIEFYKEETMGLPPSDNITKLFLEILEEGEYSETN